MNLRLFLFLILATALGTSACSVYKSSGRKSFESKATGNINTSSNAGVAINEMDKKTERETCWSQLATEPLWQLDSESPLVVTKLNDDEIQVCLQVP